MKNEYPGLIYAMNNV